MKIIFCSDPLYPDRPDRTYNEEVQAATAVGLKYELVNYEKLVHDGDAATATRRIREADGDFAIYRGWMLRPATYEALYGALEERGIHLINTPQQYRHCHYLPESYSVIVGHTPHTVYLPLSECLTEGSPDMDVIAAHLEAFGDKPLILKDYVKSRKHDWEAACYIPQASDRAAVERIVKRFIELQGSEINEGLVFREYVELKRVGTHAKSGMPLTREYRLFFLDGELLHLSEYWDKGEYDGDKPPVEEYTAIARKVQSRFFTMDVAQQTNDSWVIIELGDGQVAGLPDNNEAGTFYQAIAGRLMAT